VNASTENVLVNVNGQSFMQFDHLSFKGANISTFRIINSKNITVQNCSIDFSGTDAIYASASPNLTIENSVIDHSQNDAITLDSSCRSALIKNNHIRNTGLIPGMGKSGTGSFQAISAFGENSMIELNEIDSTGYVGIYFGGNGTTAKNNLIQYFCTVKDDGAGIYVGDWFPSTGKKIIGNIILNGVGSLEGINTKFPIQVEGIYIDDNTADVTIQANSVANCPHAGIMIHNAHNITIEGNTVFNNGIQLMLQHDNLWPNSPIKNLRASRNIFFCKAAGQICLNILSPNDDIGSFGILDSNYYYRSLNIDIAVQRMTNIWTTKSAIKNFSLSGWQATYNNDLNSMELYVKEADTANIHLEYNASVIKKATPLKGHYIHFDKMINSNELILQPYRSVIFFKN
jgi:parallel beta-helix repeat protein